MPFVSASHSSCDRPLCDIQSSFHVPVFTHVSATQVSFAVEHREPTTVHAADVGAGVGGGVGRSHLVFRSLAHTQSISDESMQVREQSPLTKPVRVPGT